MAIMQLKKQPNIISENLQWRLQKSRFVLYNVVANSLL